MSMFVTLILKSGLIAVGGSVAESKYAPKGDFFGATPLILIGTSFWITAHGMVVGKARAKYSKLAKDAGEKDVDERYGLPNLYAQGTSIHARSFNCVQRSHQHIFEGFTQVCVAGMTAALSFPLTTAATTLMYAVGRYSASTAYANADGDASKRSNTPLYMCMWYGTVATYLLGLMSCAKMLMGSSHCTRAQK